MFGMGEEEGGIASEEMKEMIYDTNFYLLTITIIISVLHSIFEIFAVKYGILS